MKTTIAEENYLKAIFKHAEADEPVSTNTLAAELSTTPASVTDMLKKLADKTLVSYIPYKGAKLTKMGEERALTIIRKHRLWETFLVEKLKFGWDEVHDAAEQLEHINNPLLVQKLDEFLGYPRYDPHGEPIPDASGKMAPRSTRLLAQVDVGEQVRVAGVLVDEAAFLQHLDRIGIRIDTTLQVLERISLDNSLLISLAGREQMITTTLADNIIVWE